MEQKQDKLESEQFSDIINPSGVNVDLFIKACQDQQIQSLTEFIETVLKILKLYDKPGRANPIASLPQAKLSIITEKLKQLQSKLEHTVYEFKINKILPAFQIISSNKSLKDPQETSKKPNINLKVQQILSNPKILNNKFSHPTLLYDFVISEILPQVGRQILSINDHQKRYQQVLKGLNLCNYLIHPTQLQIQISKNTLLQTRIYKMKYESQFQITQIGLWKKAANIINQALLCPSDIRIQGLLLKILKRMYKLWGELVHGPLYLNLRNISLFFNQDANTLKVIKEAAIFCYSAINSKSDIKFADMLMSSDDFKDLKRNQFYSSKGLALPFEVGTLYDTRNLQLPCWQYKLHLDNREVYAYPVIIQKSNTLLFWSFSIQDFDIGFGLFKVNMLKKYELEEYNKGQQCKVIIKMNKYGNGTPISKMPIKGHAFLKSGLYHLVFDNSHSMVRGKDLALQVCQLQATA